LAFKITFKNSVSRDLKKNDKSEVKVVLDKIENELSIKADQFPILTGKFSGLRKYRVGNYRIIYTIMNDSILILRIAHRKTAYK
jgi:mRNA interferase RelE/StbE